MFFQRLGLLSFSIAPKKAFLSYPSTALLEQRVNAYGYSTTEEKLKALQDLKFLKTAARLEKYIGLVRTTTKYTPYLSQLVAPLQEAKKMVVQQAPIGEHARKQ